MGEVTRYAGTTTSPLVVRRHTPHIPRLICCDADSMQPVRFFEKRTGFVLDATKTVLIAFNDRV
jgi:hypothetical protein